MLAEDRVDRLEQVELEIRADPEDEEQAEEDREDHRDEREPREVESHDQQVEREHAQKEHREQILRRPEPIDLVHGRGGRRRARLSCSAVKCSLSTAVLSGLVGSCVRSWMIHIPAQQDQRHDGRRIQEDHLGPHEDPYPLLVMRAGRRRR